MILHQPKPPSDAAYNERQEIKSVYCVVAVTPDGKETGLVGLEGVGQMMMADPAKLPVLRGMMDYFHQNFGIKLRLVRYDRAEVLVEKEATL